MHIIRALRLARLLPLTLVTAILVTGCGIESASIFAAAEVAAIPVFHRSLPDIVVSALSGQDCSVVRLDQGKTWCREIAPPPQPPPFCTRSLGVVDCWANPQALTDQPPRGVADGPLALTPAQEANRTRPWPGL